MDRKARALALGAVLALAVIVSHAQEADPLGTGTFSILGYDPATGELGGAVQSRVFSVGNGVLWAEAEVGIAATPVSASAQSTPLPTEKTRDCTAPPSSPVAGS